jgi:hypothetical protein
MLGSENKVKAVRIEEMNEMGLVVGKDEVLECA